MKAFLPRIVIIASLSAMVVQAVRPSPAGAIAANAGYFLFVAVLWLSILSALGLWIGDSETIKKWRAGQSKVSRLQRFVSRLFRWVPVLVCAGMGWYWLAAGALVVAILVEAAVSDAKARAAGGEAAAA